MCIRDRVWGMPVVASSYTLSRSGMELLDKIETKLFRNITTPALKIGYGGGEKIKKYAAYDDLSYINYLLQ